VSDPLIIELRTWSRLAEELQQDRVRLGNRLHEQLWRYYPQMLDLTDDIAAEWFLDLWTMAPVPSKANHLRHSSIDRLLKRYRIRRITAEAVLLALSQPAIKVADGVANAACGSIRSLIARLRVINHELRSTIYKLDGICADLDRPPLDGNCGDSKLNDIAILKSIPGIGRINLATLLAEASGPLSRRDYQALRTLSGVAPVTKQSGKSRVVVRRYAAHARLGNAVYHWARVAIQHDPKSRSRYATLRHRGHPHGRAIRGVADRLLALACTLLERQAPFDPHFGEVG
jgi:Transposase IS116/IS110/IS902 family